MKLRAWFLLALASMLFACGALAQSTTYVFPYEGFRYTQKDTETVLTQTNLDDHEALIASLGTTKEAVLASYMASGIVMEVIPQDGGQIAVSVADAGDFADVKGMDALDDTRLAAFEKQFADSGLYESVSMTETTPVCVRLTSSAMYASMPVYTLRYATLHLGRLYMISQTIVGREPQAQDDARMTELLSGMKLLSTVSSPTPAPTPVPTPTPEPTPAPTAGVAEVVSTAGDITVEGVPAYTTEAQITVSGRTVPSAYVRVAVGDKVIGKTNAKKDGTFAVKVTLPEEGEQMLAVMTNDAEVMLVTEYEMAPAKLVITEPANTTFEGDNVIVRGETEPNATVYVTGKGNNTNVKAGKNGGFSVRIFINDEETLTFGLRAKAAGRKETTTEITLTRRYSEREGLAKFREKMISVDYEDLLAEPQRFAGRQFSYRGRIEAVTDYDGRACVLVCQNVSTGVWKDPVWIVLDGGEDVAVGSIATFYVTVDGLTMPADGTYTRDGAAVEAPVVHAAYVTDIK